MTAPDTSAVAQYRTWQRDTVRVGSRSVRVATKPGVVAHGTEDIASRLLAEHAVVRAGDRVAHLNCGTGLFGAHASHIAKHVVLTDRNWLSYEAASRTVEENECTNTSVSLLQGLQRAREIEHGSLDVVGIRIPQDRLSQLQLLLDAFRALRAGGACYIAGAVNEGIKPATRALAALFGNAVVLATGGGERVVRATRAIDEQAADTVARGGEFANPLLASDAFHESPVTLRGRNLSLQTRPGVFSWEHLDEATGILADTMQGAAGDRVLDLGCGCGALGTVAASVWGASVCMVDADSEAVRCALRTASMAGVTTVRALASDVALAVTEERFDVVVSNPPFHVGKSTNLDVPMQFIEQAWSVLEPGGRLQLVANRTLPYERAMTERFGNLATLHDGARFKVLQAIRKA